MLNVAIIMGRLTSDPELRTTSTGISVCRFTVAVDRNYQRQGEERKTDFINVVAWRQQAEFVSKYFAKGSMIIVQGSVQTSSYTDNNGNKRNSTEIVADRASFGESKRNRDERLGGRDEQPARRESSFSNAGPDDFQDLAYGESDEDLPF